ncbi:2-C-methyl-D-erythritol 4-phosphate cytidylyltransferase [Cellulomonas hominis]|jgi:2-C-methyl-D-erythritol 4-phosphate cytidylyltransferase|uniref:2-C-methyl-D-erythritol 4-phosphate cytidylyltransferase n=1 Tax=Cellulomonas hominis TaxID=156981 RepID=A0A511FEY5_9CELL|nr:2-C-methyl-D-erythritol 4-phosphate cytidylyltransferase [Cellulomonas hominis]MBB5472274.1 2-C-methyl-D-erythritol 4-phosphate cytidylyltransferase [Cellulomonas hominis]MBU5422119.1 2-C-methyl-D-erythritol 4-phosphate cytidylyltransferase [Cellulomonas hominis]GEL46388.1 2-C-methyl-D-erythritol 4-phosphate cytidylyltransferase [Cellulomonas hominis]
MTTAAILTAAGSGTRLGLPGPKALVELAGVPLVLHAARRLAASGVVASIVVTVPPGRAGGFRALLGGPVRPGLGVPVTVVEGSTSRQASVAAGLAALPSGVDVVLVHDAARALASPDLVRAVESAVRSGHRAVVPGLPVADTIKQVGDPVDGAAPVVATVPRATMRAVQTPQGFDRVLLDAAHAAGADRAADEATAATDDAALVEALGERVWVVPGEEGAMKITTTRDLAVAELLARAETPAVRA